MKTRSAISAALAAAALLPLLFAPSCANTTQAPSGGDKDTIPPVLLWTYPQQGITGVPTEGAAFQFGFDEYVVVKDAKGIFLSPPLSKAPMAKVKGKSVIVYFEEELAPETTYTLSFNAALADNNEGNFFPGFTYVFSTGETIDSLLVTGKVLDCETLQPKKGATVMLYRDLSDSAVFLSRPDAATLTDEWGYFSIPYLADTLYRLYAVEDANSDNMYNPDDERIAFTDSVVRPAMRVCDTIPEMLHYDMKDTASCEARIVEHTLRTFKGLNSRQSLIRSGRTAERYAHIAFSARGAWIDSLWIQGYPQKSVITQFNLQQDSLEIWINDRRPAPDTLHLWVNYRRTDSLGVLTPSLEHVRLFIPDKPHKSALQAKKDLKHEDTVCVYKLEAQGETVEQNGFSLEFRYPIIYEKFKDVVFHYLTPRQQEETGTFKVERDSLNLRRYVIRPDVRMLPGYEYHVKLPHHAFRDITGFCSDSTDVKVSLPTDETLSLLTVKMAGVDRKVIVDLMDEKRSSALRTYVTDKDAEFRFPYLKAGKYSIRITEDVNRNSIVDTGDLLEHRQPEKVVFVKLEDGGEYLEVPASAEMVQEVNLKEALDD